MGSELITQHAAWASSSIIYLVLDIASMDARQDTTFRNKTLSPRQFKGVCHNEASYHTPVSA